MGNAIITRRGGGSGYATINFNLPVSPPTKIAVTNLSQARSSLAATTVGNYALFAGGDAGTWDGGGGISSVVDAYDQNLNKPTPQPTGLSQARYNLAATTVGNYALFAGGHGGSNSSVVDAYDQNLNKPTPQPTGLSQARSSLAATTVGNYALFAGGHGGSNSSVVDAYDQNLNKPTPQPTGLSQTRYDLAATTVGNYALFAGGDAGMNDLSDVVDAYDQNLNKPTPQPTGLSQARSSLAATTVGNYALFAGGYGGSNSSVVDAYSSTNYDIQLFPGTKYSFNGAAESTSSTWQTIRRAAPLVGYLKIKNTIIN